MKLIPNGKFLVVELWNIQEGEVKAIFNSEKEAKNFIKENNLPLYNGFEGYEVQLDYDIVT